MQILLTEKEYDKLISKNTDYKKKYKETLQKLCTEVALLKPIKLDWAPERDPAPWGCILSKENHSGYCDRCPVEEVCPNEHKEWSK